jgi:transcriptional regulator
LEDLAHDDEQRGRPARPLTGAGSTARPALDAETIIYLPESHEETNLATLHALVRAHPLGAWATLCNNELTVNHLPFVVRDGGGPYGTLVGHVARANPVWSAFAAHVPSIIVFQGAEAYVTPSWYPSKHAHGKAVPTWNYAVVHAHGVPRAIEDKDWLLTLVNELTDTHEARQALPWKVSDAPHDYLEQMLDRIVGIEMPIAKLVGKWKVSQNRPLADKLGVVAGLTAESSASAQAMAALVREHV